VSLRGSQSLIWGDSVGVGDGGVVDGNGLNATNGLVCCSSVALGSWCCRMDKASTVDSLESFQGVEMVSLWSVPGSNCSSAASAVFLEMDLAMQVLLVVS